MNDRREAVKTLLAAAALAGVSNAQKPNAAKIIHRQPLPAPFDGLDAAFVEVTVPPGPGSPPHRHSGFVLGYVLEGEFRFGVRGQPEQTLKAGDVFYEPPDAVHNVSASAQKDRPARILAIIIGDKGKNITTFDR
jgi:quercetin dioxygenase-like cupin family protein